MRLITKSEKTIIRAEIHQFPMHRRALHALPLLTLGIFAVVWEHAPSVYFLVAVFTFTALEPQFNNILFRTPLELDALGVFPYPWRQILRAKNIATIILAGLFFAIATVILNYFSPRTTSAEQLVRGIVYFASLLFPLLQLGNIRSFQQPRRATGWQVDDLAECVGTLVAVMLCSIPYLLLVVWMDSLPLAVAYCIGTALVWHRSLETTACAIEEHYFTILEKA